MTPLVRSAQRLDLQELERVMALGVEAAEACLALREAAWAPEGGEEVVSLQVLHLLLQHGAAVDSKEGRRPGWTPLHHAAAVLKRRSMTLLLQEGAARDLQDPEGFTPLHYVMWAQDTEEERTLACVKLLLDAGAAVDTKDLSGYTALHWALYQHKTRTSALLVERGADTMALSLTGWTPLTVCVYWSLLASKDPGARMVADSLRELASKILSSPRFTPTNLDAVNDEGGTALGYATTYGLSELVILIILFF